MFWRLSQLLDCRQHLLLSKQMPEAGQLTAGGGEMGPS